jgi:thioredoxin-dependent peroxiredoxin
VKFDKQGVVIIGVSADPIKLLQSFRSKHRLNFYLLSDPTHKMLTAYDAWRTKRFMGRTFQGIVRSSYLIGPGGKIEEVWDPVKAKGHAAEVLVRLDAAA